MTGESTGTCSFDDFLIVGRSTVEKLDSSSGDPKFKDSVDLETGMTKVLGLKVIPTKIDRSDVGRGCEGAFILLGAQLGC